MNSFTIYLILTASNIAGFCLAGSLIFGFAFCGFFIWMTFEYCESIADTWSFENDAYRNKHKNMYIKTKKYIKIVAIIFSFFVCGVVFVPTTDTLVSIYVAPKIINNKDIQKMPSYIVKYINSVLVKKTKENIE